MKVSLAELLRAGRLGGLRPGITRGQILEAIGAPDATGGTSRRQKRPLIFKYGDLELFFGPENSETCCSICVKLPEGSAVRLPSTLEVEEWGLPQNADSVAVESYLNLHDLRFNARPGSSTEQTELVIISSQAILTLDEDDRLFSIYIGVQG